jgi:hypothetical protein
LLKLDLGKEPSINLLTRLSVAPPRLGIEPIVIHLTWQRWSRAGKVSRLRAAGLWHMGPPTYYDAGLHNGTATFRDSGAEDHVRFLTYENGVKAFVERVAVQRYEGGAMPRLYKHWLAMSYQLAAFRWARALVVELHALMRSRNQSPVFMLHGCALVLMGN